MLIRVLKIQTINLKPTKKSKRKRNLIIMRSHEIKESRANNVMSEDNGGFLDR
jgi:hypothetical protein